MNDRTFERIESLFDLALFKDVNVLLTRELQDDQVQRIVDDIDEKVQKRLADFDSFVELIQTGVDVSHVLQERFGCA